jgi:hypothetical protein
MLHVFNVDAFAGEGMSVPRKTVEPTTRKKLAFYAIYRLG